MAYSTNPNLPKARATALRLLLVEGLSVCVVANKCGVYRSTVWRWKKKRDDLNPLPSRVNLSKPTPSTMSIHPLAGGGITTPSSIYIPAWPTPRPLPVSCPG